MRGPRFDDLEQALDRHARRIAKEVGGLLVDVGEALRRQAEKPEPEPPGPAPSPPSGPPETTREDLLREAAELGIRGRSRMSKEELRDAIRRARAD
jgi:Rho termination factor, N-terminal domain